VERANSIEVARGKVSSQAVSHTGEEAALQRDFGLKPRRLTAWVNTQRLAAG